MHHSDLTNQAAWFAIVKTAEGGCMRKSVIRLLGAAALFALPNVSIAGLPSDYGAVAFDKALAASRADGKPVMLYFGEDW